jgi:dTDP-4-amino-4,6-dideoxygalactose transaminase
LRKRVSFLPFHVPSVTEAEIEAVTEALREKWISSGPRVRAFEQAFAEAVGAKHAVALNSGTAALHLALEALGIGEGDDVVVPVMTFAATAEVVVHLGARPVFVDCFPDSLLLDADKLEAAATPRAKAVVPVHFAGQACDMDEILAFARGKGLAVVEDAAHAFPAAYRGRNIGTIGDATAFSFYSTKPLAAGEGGMLTTDDESIARRVKIMSLHGMSFGGEYRYRKEGTWRYEITAPGFKYNLPELQAALGLVQLRRREELLAKRKALAERYNAGLGDLNELEPPPVLPERRHAWHLFVIRLRTETLKIDRDRFIEELRERNIGTSVHFIPLHRQPYYRDTFGLRPEDFPNAETAYHRIVSLPLWPDMTPEDAADVVTAVRDIIEENRR